MANSRVMFSLPRWLLQWSVEKMANYKFNHQRLGLNPVHRALEAFPTINEDIHLRIMNGAIRVRPNVKCFTENGVMFDDNTFESIDVVILATGYDYKYRFLSSTVLNTENNNIELYKYVFPPQLPHPTLAMIGLVQAVGAVMPISELQSRWFTRIVKGHLTLPSKEIMMEDIAQRKKNVRQTFLPSQRHALQTFWVPYMDELADAVGCKPNLKKMFFRDPMFALWCFVGPCVPAQFRLEGPGKWEGARSAVKNCYANMFGATERPAPPAGESSIWNRLSNRSTCVRENVRRFRKSVAVNHNHGPGYYIMETSKEL
ncbi:dimethylaniline monooxygenase [N-oxide-forming] 5-like [Lingula anatina]|uniref:Flavin-containing monooxygenase n=1 Tax=Lingula anatina TaxID=7574 RepID=A0A1S3KEU8_LINAN|nr:dimethylaniline monooxygenase [N-oxide-forming] 5-like [Lingula anatina]|eukprot:XP_013420766.2 dimethylaniline monooxygenase [N-oxide-forming] 5-like [Lingula anatina]